MPYACMQLGRKSSRSRVLLWRQARRLTSAGSSAELDLLFEESEPQIYRSDSLNETKHVFFILRRGEKENVQRQVVLRLITSNMCTHPMISRIPLHTLNQLTHMYTTSDLDIVCPTDKMLFCKCFSNRRNMTSGLQHLSLQRWR